jgi:hypothetical protein
MALDSNNIYWCDGGNAVQKSPLNQITQTGIPVAAVTTSCSSPVSDGTYVYWIDGTDIHKAPVGGDGGAGTVFISGQTGINSLAYDSSNGYLYWGAGNVRRAPTTGSDAGTAEDWQALDGGTAANVSFASGFVGWSTASGVFLANAASGSVVQSIAASGVTDLAAGSNMLAYVTSAGVFSTNGGTAHEIATPAGLSLVITGTTAFWRDGAATTVYSASAQ